MANPLKGETTAFIGGVSRRLRLDINAMIEVETHLKRSIVDLMGGGLGYRESVAVIHFALQGGGLKQPMAATVKLLDGLGIGDLLGFAVAAITAAQPADEPKNDDAPGASA